MFINALAVFLLLRSANEDIGRKQDPLSYEATDLRITSRVCYVKTSFQVISTETPQRECALGMNLSQNKKYLSPILLQVLLSKKGCFLSVLPTWSVSFCCRSPIKVC